MDHGIEPSDGHYTDATREALANDANVKPISAARQNTTAQDLVDQGSRTVAATQKIEKASLLTYACGTAAAIAGTVAKYYSDASSYLAQARDTFTDLSWVWLGPLLLILIVAYLHWQGSKAQAARVDDERTARNTAEPNPQLVERVLGDEVGE